MTRASSCSSISCVTALTVPAVPTGMKTGVSISPWAVSIRPARACVAGSLCSTLKVKLFTASLKLLERFERSPFMSFGFRVNNHQGFADNQLARHGSPVAAVHAVIAAVTQHEVMVLRNLTRLRDAEFQTVIDLEVVTVGRPFDVVKDSIPRALRLRLDFDDGRFRLLRAGQANEGALFRQFLAVNDDAAAFYLNPLSRQPDHALEIRIFRIGRQLEEHNVAAFNLSSAHHAQDSVARNNRVGHSSRRHVHKTVVDQEISRSTR